MPPKRRKVSENVRRMVEARIKHAAGEGTSAQGSKRSKTSSHAFISPSLPPPTPASFCPVPSDIMLSKSVAGPVLYSSTSAPPPASFSTPVSSSNPALLFGGEYDLQNYVKVSGEIPPELMKVVDVFQNSLTREEMHEIARQSCPYKSLTSVFSSLAKVSIIATSLVPIWNEYVELKSKVTGLESQVADQKVQHQSVETDFQRFKEEHTRAEEKIVQELATAKREASEMTARIKELEVELVETKGELTNIHSSFDETVTARATEQAAEQILFVMDALERRFPGADHTWIYRGVDDHIDDDTLDVPPLGDHPAEDAVNIIAGGGSAVGGLEGSPVGGSITGSTEDVAGAH